ncbi:MAG TPA: alpha/beta hydrolase [Bryobacteraceae bacterium]|nr:alpha/beta hydrolase [Bryobacteraceae bacterium]
MRILAGVFITVLAQGQNIKEIRFYSENVQCYAKIFLPAGFTADGKSPAVVLAPGWGETAASIEKYAARFAEKGMVAMAIDYRGWGKSGGYVYLAESVRFDDRLRFSQHTAKVRIRRKRLIPDDQVDDIRNAISYLQGEPGVDRSRIGVWGTGMSGGHAMVIAGIDPRIKAVVALAPVIGGKDVPRQLSKPEFQATQVKLARADSAAAALMSSEETRIALAEYHPFWFVSQIPQTVAVLFLVEANDKSDAVAASKVLKGPTEVKPNAADAATEWFAKYL